MSSLPRQPSRRGADSLEQGLDRLVNAGRQLVDGVSGARPGSRPGPRNGSRGAGGRPRLDSLGRWMEDKLDWILEDGEDWREPWQEERPTPTVFAPTPRRRPLEAISRRTGSLQRQVPEREQDWNEQQEQPPFSRPLPRSSRRRPS